LRIGWERIQAGATATLIQGTDFSKKCNHQYGAV
jgi:hypothetical protein